MTRKEKIAEAARKYATHPTDTDVTDFHGKWVKETKYNHDEYLAFLEGAEWADENSKSPWISVKDDLPCNNSYLTSSVCTDDVIVYECGKIYNSDLKEESS